MPEETKFLQPKDLISKLNIIEGMQVADLGCGNLGFFIIPIAKLLGPNGKAYAVDILKSVLEAVRSKAKLQGITNLETVWSNLEMVGSTKIPEQSLDFALLINILFQNKNHQAIMQEAARLLKSQGRLVVVEWQKKGIPFGPPVENRVDPNEIKEIAKKLNLDFEEEYDLSEYFWGLGFKKA